MMIQIREALPADAAGIITVNLEGTLATYVNKAMNITAQRLSSLAWFSEESVNRTARRLAQPRPKARSWVAVKEEIIVGFAEVGIQYSRNFLNALYVKPVYFGCGVGPALLQRALQCFASEEVFLQVVSYNGRAIRFYSKHGFQEIHDEVMPATMYWPGDISFPIIHMKRLVK